MILFSQERGDGNKAFILKNTHFTLCDKTNKCLNKLNLTDLAVFMYGDYSKRGVFTQMHFAFRQLKLKKLSRLKNMVRTIYFHVLQLGTSDTLISLVNKYLTLLCLITTSTE